MASAMEDPSKQFIESVDTLQVPSVSNSYDITGYRAAHVIAILKSIVNDKLWQQSGKKKKEFTFKIEDTIVFSVKPNPGNDKPGNDQPGNALVLRKNPEDRRKLITRRYDTALVTELNLQYSYDTKRFAQDIKLVFEDNSHLLGCGNEVIQDVYILLLFEIGRRLVKDGKNPRDGKKAFDNLPISGAITKIVKLFEARKCIFADFFDSNGRFHCFTGTPSERKERIRILTLESEVKYKDIKELFYGEEATKESPEEDAKVSDLFKKFKNLDVS